MNDMDMETALRAEIRRLRDDAASSADLIHALRCECDDLRKENMVLRPQVSELKHQLAMRPLPDPCKGDTEYLPAIQKA